MNIAILGGGYTGLTAAYELTRRGYTATIFEKEPVLGGLAVGFKAEGWDWPLERAYHHLFASDSDILQFAREIGFSDIIFRTPHTDSLYAVDSPSSPGNTGSRTGNNYRIFPVDTPQDFLRFPLLPLPDRIRAAAVLGFLRYSPFLPFFERVTAVDFIKKSMGERVWNIWWEQLFRKKFGKYAENVLLAWFWSRISKRTQSLGYIKGGFQTFVEFLEKENRKKGVTIKNGYAVSAIRREGEEFVLIGQDGQRYTFDAVISTLPTPILIQAGREVLPQEYRTQLSRIHYLHALVLIIESKEKILDKTYWLNICDAETPLMFIGQHTNFMDARHYAGHELCYIGYYLEQDDPLMSKSKEELFDYLKPYINKISGKSITPLNLYHFKAPFAQPIYDKTFVQSKPSFITPVERFYIANLDMTYPYDRGTNYAVKLGREVAAIVR